MKLYGTRRLFGKPEQVFSFDPDLAVFAPGMAKRAGTVFAAAPMVQGNWDGTGTPDALSFARGDAVTPIGNWYENIDTYQGSIVFAITPEWDGGDGVRHALYWDGEIYIEKGTSNFLGLTFYSGGAWPGVAVDVSGWVAGTTYFVVFRWDADNSLDGTNYACITVNNINTFGVTGALSPSEASSTASIGAMDLIRPGSAIIEGFTFYRRPLFDGAYGVDVGFRDAVYSDDEIAAIHAAGAGQDPCLVTGSWDAVFCCPTNATPEELVTGEGEAWSHPHSSALLEHTWLEDGGYLGRPYGVLYNGTTTSAVVSDGVAIQDLADDAFTPEAWIRSDGAGEASSAFLLCKRGGGHNEGWLLFVDETQNSIQARVQCATTTASSVSEDDSLPADGKWHHITMFFDDAGDRKIYLAIDGVWETSYEEQVAGVGAIVSDVGNDLYIGNRVDNDRTYGGTIGWCRITAGVGAAGARYTVGTDFVPVRQAPATDGNTAVLYHFDEGTGATADNETGAAAYDATLTNHVWEEQWDIEGTPVVPYSVEFFQEDDGIDFGSGANIDNLFSADCTVEFWGRRPDDEFTAMSKMNGGATIGWLIYAGATTLRMTAVFAGGNAVVDANMPPDNRWHHYAFDWDVGTLTLRSFLDGVLDETDAAAGAYSGDASYDLIVNGLNAIGLSDGEWSVGPIRLSNTRRYTGNSFVPPSRNNWMANDANAHLITTMRDGAGATVTDYSGNAYHGTITFGATTRWNHTPDMHIDAPGQKLYGDWGYVLGMDAANEGTTQIQTGLSSGDDFVMRIPLQYERDRQFWPRLQVYDEIGAAPIVDFYGPRLVDIHTGGNNLATLINANGHFPQSLVGGALYNVTDGSSTTITAISGDQTTCTGVLAGGTDNDWDTNDVYMLVPPHEDSWVWCETFCVELPAGCTSASWKVMNLNSEGAAYMHQVEVQESLITNGSLEVGAGNPWIPTGWTNQDLAAGESAQDNALFHSGAGSVAFNAADNHRFRQAGISVTAGGFYVGGVWGIVTANRLGFGRYSNDFVHQATGTAFELGVTDSTWTHSPGVARAVDTGIIMYVSARNGASQFNVDDLYLFALDAVSLTATPANEANSTEASGLRVDGADGLPQPVAPGAISRFHGHYRANYTPRHDLADVGDWGNANAVFFHHQEDANNYIFARAEAGLLRLGFNASGGGLQQGAWAGAWLRTVPHRIDVVRSPTRAVLYMDGALILTVAAACVFATDFTAAVNWCSAPLPWNEYDGTIA